MSYMELGRQVQNALREEIRNIMASRSAKVRNPAALSRALGYGESRQYIASRFAPDPKSGKIRDLTVPDLVAIGEALGVPAEELLRRAAEMVDRVAITATRVAEDPAGDGTADAN